MAESEQTGIGLEEGLPTPEADDQRRSTGVEETVGYWCYQCNKEVAVDAGGVDEGELAVSMICNECGGGFIEAIATARPEFRGIVRRRRSRDAAHSDQSRIAFLLEHVYPQQFMHVLQALHQVTAPPNSTEQRDHSSNINDITTVQEDQNNSGQADQNNSGMSVLERSDVEEEGNMESLHIRVVDLEEVDTERQERISRQSSVVLDGQDEDGEGAFVDLDSEDEETRLEYGGWGSASAEDAEDDEEWEEFEEEEGEVHNEAEQEGELHGEAEEEEGELHEASEEAVQGAGDAATEVAAEGNGEVSGEQTRGITFQAGVHWYLQNILQSLSGSDVQVFLDLPDYVGNPGDYLDSRGFQNFLHQMAENDNSHRGAPPAAKVAVENLSAIQIEKHHVENGMISCSICNDLFGLGDVAKQLPCSHLYHHDCIVTWLSSRNSCPMCRYELPTDDPDYESQKQMEVTGFQIPEPPSTADEQTGEEERSISAQNEATNSPGAVQVTVSSPSLTPGDLTPSTSSQAFPNHSQKP